MNNLNQVLVIRKDLNLNEGMLAAQAAHVGSSFMMVKAQNGVEFTDLEKNWFPAPVVIVKSVSNPEELTIVENAATQAGLQVTKWTDTIPSADLGIYMQAVIGISIGPDDADTIKQVTGNLPLY